MHDNTWNWLVVIFICDILKRYRYCSKSVLLKKWELFKVIQRCPNLVPLFRLSAKMRFNPFDTIGNSVFRNVMILKKDDFAKFVEDYWTSRCLICYKFCKVIHFWCHESSKRRFANGTESNGLNLFFPIRGIVDQGLKHLFNASSSSHVFNKTDFERHILKS